MGFLQQDPKVIEAVGEGGIGIVALGIIRLQQSYHLWLLGLTRFLYFTI